MSDLDDLARWRDRIAIEELKARYFRALDTRDWAAWHAVFHADVEVCVPMATGGGELVEICGADAYVKGARRAVDGCVSVHQGHMPEIEFVSNDRAEGVWSMEDLLEWDDGRRLHGYGHYHETYVRTPEGWRIARLRLVRTRVDLSGPWPF